MTDKSQKAPSPLEIFLRDREAKLSAELAAVRSDLAEYLSVKQQSQPAAPPVKAVVTAPERDWSDHKITDALMEYLRTIENPQSPSEIWDACEKAGVRVEAEDPVKSVRWALRKRAKMIGDIVQVSFGKWDLRERYSEAKLKEMAKINAGRGGRTRKAHSKLTKEGLRRHREAGGRHGAPRKLTAARVIQLKALLDKNEISVVAACSEVGISPALYYLYRNRIAVWKEGTPWPPSVPTKEQLDEIERRSETQTQLRVVK